MNPESISFSRKDSKTGELLFERKNSLTGAVEILKES
jgi:hypothetical protein